MSAPPLDPATGRPYFSIAASGWGKGWKAGPVFSGKLADLVAQCRAAGPLASADSVVLRQGGGGEGLTEADDALLDKLRARVADQMARNRDDELRAALTRALGDGWTPEALAGRTAHVVATDTYLLDGRPLLRFARPRFSQVDAHLHWSQDVERFDWSPA